MCGRYVLEGPVEKILRHFETQRWQEMPDVAMDIHTHWTPSYNIAPTTVQPVVRFNRVGERVVIPHRWGLVPHWAKDTSMSAKLTNARSETIFDKPSFRTAVRKFRCLIPASGYYEWQAVNAPGQSKQPWYIRAPETPYLAMAGICDHWQQSDGLKLLSFSVVTCAAHPELAHIHDRMPVMIQPKDWEEWLTPEHPSPMELTRLFRPTPGLAGFKVGRSVSATRGNRQDHPGLIEPLSD